MDKNHKNVRFITLIMHLLRYVLKCCLKKIKNVIGADYALIENKRDYERGESYEEKGNSAFMWDVIDGSDVVYDLGRDSACPNFRRWIRI